MLASFEDFSVGNLVFGGMIGVVIDAESGAINQYPDEVSLMVPPGGFATEAERDAFFDVLKADSECRAQQALEAANISGVPLKSSADHTAESSRIIAAHLSPIMMAGALVLPEMTVGMIEQSATRRLPTPFTRSRSSTTAMGSEPILQVPQG